MSDFFKRIDEVWDAYQGELERLTGPSSDLSLLQPYRASRGFPADPVKFPKFTNFRANQECNAITDFSSTSNHPIYTGAQLTDRYAKFLADLAVKVSLKAMTPEEKVEEERLRKEKNDRRGELITFDTRVDSLWLDYKTAHQVPSDDKEWIARMRWEQHYLYDQDRTTFREALVRANAAHWLFLLKVLPPSEQALSKAIEYWTNTSFEETFPPATTYENEPTHDHWGKFKSQTLTLNYDDFFANPSVRKMTIAETTKRSETRKSNWNASGGYSLGFISVGGSGGGSSDETHIRENTEKIEISWDRLEEVDIFRAPWFQDTLFSTYGSLLKGYWGPGGILSCYPTKVVLARGLKISLHMNQVAKDAFNRVVSGSAGVSIGPWSIGGGGGSEEHIQSSTEKDYGYLIEDGLKTARVLAVRIVRPNYKSVAPKDFSALLEADFKEFVDNNLGIAGL